MLGCAVSSITAATFFSATTTNTTLFTNGSADNGSQTLTCATPDLLLNNGNGGFNNGGFASTDSIDTLAGAALLATDTVTMSLTVDSIGGAGALRANGINVGMAGTVVFEMGFFFGLICRDSTGVSEEIVITEF